MLTNIETERVRKGLTQEQLASQLGVSHKTYYNWINEKKDIPSQKLKKMSRMFKTNMEYLLGEEQKRVLYLCDGFQRKLPRHDGRPKRCRKCYRWNGRCTETGGSHVNLYV